jgi:hypothetical protein
LLVQNPVIQSFVRTITLVEDIHRQHPVWVNGTSLLAILRLPFCCLECFTITLDRSDWAPFNWDWYAFSSEVKDALSNIIHSSTLKTLTINGMTNVPITYLLPIFHLTTLELHSMSPNDFHDKNSSSLVPAASKGVAPMASRTVIRVDRCVWHFSGYHIRGTRLPSSAYFSVI